VPRRAAAKERSCISPKACGMSHSTWPGEGQWHEIKASPHISLDVLLTQKNNTKQNPHAAKIFEVQSVSQSS